MSASIELFGDRTDNCLRTVIALEEAHLRYTLHHVSLWRRAHQRHDFLALNRLGKVPVLVDRRGPAPLVLTQSNAIMMHIAEAAPHYLLPVESPHDRARFHELLFYFVTDVIGLTHAAMHMAAIGSNSGQNAFVLRAARHMEMSEGFLGDGLFMLGRRFSLVDIAAVSAASALEGVIDWRSVPRLRDWFDLVSMRPSVTRGMQAFDAARAGTVTKAAQLGD